MTNVKISELPLASSVTPDDLFVIVDDLSGTPTTKKVPAHLVRTSYASTLTYQSTAITDASAGEVFDITLTGDVTIGNPINPVNGKTIRWRIMQDATGNRKVTLGNKFAVPSTATTPLGFSTGANKMDILAATYHAGRDKWDVVALVSGY